MKQNAAQSDNDPFLQSFSGYFTSLLRWQDLDEFWPVLRAKADAGWYIYAIGETPPQQPSSAADLHTFIDEIDALLRKEHEEEYCGIVYTDNKTDPSFIKVYDPSNLGVVCGYSDNPPLPGWTISLLQPKSLDNNHILPGNRKRWWRRMWG